VATVRSKRLFLPEEAAAAFLIAERGVAEKLSESLLKWLVRAVFRRFFFVVTAHKNPIHAR